MFPPGLTNSKGSLLEEFCELNDLVCLDQLREFTYFQGRSRTKLDYFLLDRSASHMFLSSSFDNGLVIGTDHVPGILKLQAENLLIRSSPPPPNYTLHKLKHPRK